MKKPPATPKRRRRPRGECTIPARPDDAVLNAAVLNRSERHAKAIREYVEWQSPREKVTYLEKVATEHFFDRKLEAWDA